MQEKLKSEGKCLFCNKTFAKAGINRHLDSHLSEMSVSGKSGKSFLVKIETDKNWSNTPYFLSIWVDGEATMKNIDKFLRDIWLECCEHLSKFYDVGMQQKARNIFAKGLRLDYEYDFGSSTLLTLTVMKEYPIKADQKIVLLSRNEPLHIMCAICGKAPATQICVVCMDEDINAEFCDKCAPQHSEKCEDFADASMPIVNSPRIGICGYTGGTIDKERDCVFVLKK